MTALRPIITALLCLMAVAGVYLAFAFLEWELNPGRWGGSVIDLDGSFVRWVALMAAAAASSGVALLRWEKR